MKNASALAGDAVRRVPPPSAPARTWIRCVEGAPFFETERGEPWAPIGHNEAITWPNLAPLYRRQDPEAVDRHFAQLAESGVTCLRLMLDYNQVRHRHLENRCGTFNPALLQLWDDLIALGEKHGVRFLLTPFDTFFMARRWKSHPYSRRNGGPCRSPREMFICADTREAIINRLRFATRRWGHSPAVFAWDLWNEIDSFYAGGDLAATHDFVTQVSEAVRQEEERLYGRTHLQTASVFLPHLQQRPDLADIIYRHPALDFASVHLYEAGTIDAPQTSSAPAEATARLMAKAVGECPTERPLFDSEHGPIHAFKDRRVTLPDAFDAECFRRTQWAHLASGGAGGGMRWPYRHPHRLLDEMHAAQRVLAEFMPLMDWRTFARRPLGARLAVHDFSGLACGCGDERQVIVALFPDAAQSGHACLLEINGMVPGCYLVTQVNAATGARESNRVCSRQDGALVVLAEFSGQDIALAITPADEGC